LLVQLLENNLRLLLAVLTQLGDSHVSQRIALLNANVAGSSDLIKGVVPRILSQGSLSFWSLNLKYSLLASKEEISLCKATSFSLEGKLWN